MGLFYLKAQFQAATDRRFQARGADQLREIALTLPAHNVIERVGGNGIAIRKGIAGDRPQDVIEEFDPQGTTHGIRVDVELIVGKTDEIGKQFSGSSRRN